MTEIVNVPKLILQVVGVRMRTARRNEEDPAQDQTGPQFIGSVFVTFSSKEVVLFTQPPGLECTTGYTFPPLASTKFLLVHLLPHVFCG